MKKKNLMEQLKYSSSKCICVVTKENKLKQLFCPIKVTVLSSVGELIIGQVVWVEEIKVTVNLITVFVIKGKAYYYHQFNIEVD